MTNLGSASRQFASLGSILALSLVANVAMAAAPAVSPAAPPSQVNVLPATLAFPITTVGYNTDQQTVTVSNDSEATASVDSIGIDGTDASDFITDGSNCGGSLGPGQSCNVWIRFAPASAGEKQASLNVWSDGAPLDQSVELSGTAAAPELAFEPASYDFGLQQIYNGGSQAMLQLRNAGEGRVQVNSLEIAGDSNSFWTGYSNCYGTWLQPGDTCAVQVGFGPNEAISYSAQLRAHTNGASFTADLTGAGGQAIVAPVVDPTDFGTATVGATGIVRTIALTNTGNFPGSFFIAVIASGDIGSFRLLDENCTGRMLDPAASCTIHVRFEPVSAGAKAAQLGLFGNQADGAAVKLRGIGVDPQPGPNPSGPTFGGKLGMSPRVTFHWNMPLPQIRLRGADSAAGTVSCHAAQSCSLVARPVVVSKVRQGERLRSSAVSLPAIHLDLRPNQSRLLYLNLDGVTRSLLASGHTRLGLKLRWRADGRRGQSRLTAPIG